ncbi:ATP-binding protein [Pelomonas sp. SE-A7]|uniref:ATP-binding protein n=1 Tax=Pelomonas sp. SE-A7 TaxID=3054953 RepID=UPI00259C762B|nr:ATP-binding protein [Pelomonas sp. SE-A7]MDM4767831.1 PAS domain S-box protein [Pelomonas sp. SE-A7]
MRPGGETPALPAGMDASTVFRSLFQAYPDALLLVDAAGHIVLCNSAASLLLGYSIDELHALTVEDLVPESIRPRHAEYRDAYGKAPRARPMGTQMDLVARRRDGSEVMVEIALSPLPEQGLVVAAIRDIGAYPRVKQALQRARYSEHLAQLGRLGVDTRDPQLLLERVSTIAVEAMQVEMAAVFLLDADRNEFTLTSGVGLLTGEPIGTRHPNRPDTPPGFVVAAGRPVVVADYSTESRFAVPSAYLKAGLHSALAVPLVERGRMVGALTVRSTRIQRFGDDEVHFLESLGNLLTSSLQRARTEDALNHAQRLESVGQLTGGIAHDFNNLLTVIQGNLQVLEDLPLARSPQAQPLLAAATRASRRAAELTGKLLTFARRQVLQPAPVDLQALLSSLADMLRRTLDQRIHIELEVADACPLVMADPGQLESALLNIAINARDAMHEGGRLRFKACPCAALPTELRNELDDPSAASDRFVEIEISDSGHGMPESVRERVFEPFFTTKEAGRGTGLGLATVYGFVKQSKGAIAIASSEGAGTTVTLYIPQPWHPTREADLDAPPPPLRQGLRVLLVEDDAEVRAIIQTFLLALGCQVDAVSSAEQALLLLAPQAGEAPPFDLLLSDIALGPGLRGTELARLAQQQRPDMAVLLMSGYSSELLEADRDSPPEWELLRKPYGRDELAAAMARLLG